MPAEAAVEDVMKAYRLAWETMNKSIAVYRDGSKLSQPLSASLLDDDEEEAVGKYLSRRYALETSYTPGTLLIVR